MVTAAGIVILFAEGQGPHGVAHAAAAASMVIVRAGAAASVFIFIVKL